MTILIISAVFPPEPVTSAKLSYDIANALSETMDICVISPIPSRPLGFKFSDPSTKVKYEHIIMNSFICPQSSIIGRLIESYSFGRHCYNYISKNKSKISLVYANTWPLLSQFYVVKATLKYKIPVIIHVQDIYPESLLNKLPFGKKLLSLFLLHLDKFILRNSTQIIAISETMKNHLIETRKLNGKNICVVQNWQNDEDFKHNETNRDWMTEVKRPFTFMFLGNIGPVAGVDLLMNAFIRAKLVNCRIIIAGSGSMKESLEKKYKKSASSIIEFWTVPDGKVSEIQNFADVLLLPIIKGASLSSIPSKLPAYMLSSKPIIACVDEDGDIAKTIKLAKCGWIVPPQNIDLLSNLMSKIFFMPKEDLETIGKNGFQYAMENFSRNNNLQKIINIIDELNLK